MRKDGTRLTLVNKAPVQPELETPSNLVDFTKFTGRTAAVEQPETDFDPTDPYYSPDRDNTTFAQDVDRLLIKIGDTVNFRARATQSVEQARRWGVAVVVTGVAAVGAWLVPKAVDDIDYSMDSNIPGSLHNLNPADDHMVTIPASGAVGLAEQVDPGHDPMNGAGQFEEQLGRAPEPGDVVAVPGPALSVIKK